jgi:hypothetical protein
MNKDEATQKFIEENLQDLEKTRGQSPRFCSRVFVTGWLGIKW